VTNIDIYAHIHIRIIMNMSAGSIKFRHLRTFIEVARQKSVGRAADILAVSQPAVTRTIGELERALGVSLFERDGRGIRITRVGEVFLRHAGASVAAIGQGVDSIAQALRSEGPPIRVGALPTVSARIMPRAVEQFLATNTGSQLTIVTGENTALLDQLRSGELDLVVGRLAAPEMMSGLTFQYLYAERVLFVVRPGHPLLAARDFDFNGIRGYPVLMPTRRSIIRPFVERFLIAHGIAELPVHVETVSDSFGRAFLRRSEAIWIISEGVVANDIADGTMLALPIETSETLGAVGLTTRASATPPMSLEILIRAISDVAAEA
jgi:LysR family transcriptional regulator, pca operon transcriptional activator